LEKGLILISRVLECKNEDFHIVYVLKRVLRMLPLK
jgi:hypothetical protein